MSFGSGFLANITSYERPMLNIMAVLGGEPSEEQVLNGIWIGLLGLEALIVAGVAVYKVAGAMGPRQRIKASQ
ncbi:hypothetical protein GQ53DRAFT_842252, partial [Thozetella sp. PMI_491]